jgi:hypothetical protein
LAQVPPPGTVCLREQNLTNQRIYATATDPDPNDPVTSLSAFYVMTLPNGVTSRNIPMGLGDTIFSGPQFSIPYNQNYAKGGTVTVTVHVADSHGAQAKPYTFTFRLDPCIPGKGP